MTVISLLIYYLSLNYSLFSALMIYQNNKDIETRPLTLNTDLEDSLLEMEKNEIKWILIVL